MPKTITPSAVGEYVEIFDSDSNRTYRVPTMVLIDPTTGQPYAAGGGGGGGGADREIVITTYRANAAGTGFSIGDTITASRVLDVSGASAIQVGITVWFNETTGLALAGAPSAASLDIAGTPGLTNAQLRAAAVVVSAPALTSLDADVGNVADAAAPANGTGDFSLVAAAKRAALNFFALLARLPAALGAAVGAASFPVVVSTETATGAISVQNSVPNGVATANSSVEILLNGASHLTIQTTGTYTGALSLQFTNDGARWETVTAPFIVNALSGVGAATIASASIGLFEARCSGWLRARITALAAVTGAAAVTLRATNAPGHLVVQQPTAANLAMTASLAAAQTLGTLTTLTGGAAAEDAATSSNPHIMGGVVRTATAPTSLVAGDAARLSMTSAAQASTKPWGLPETDWQFTGALTTATAVAAKAAGAAGIRNYCTDLSFQNTSATATTVLLQDGATTIAQFNAPANMASPAVIPFPTPKRGTAATAMNVNCGTAAANVLINVGGYQAA